MKVNIEGAQLFEPMSIGLGVIKTINKTNKGNLARLSKYFPNKRINTTKNNR